MAHEEHESHGHSVAAWVSSAVMIVAFAIGSAAMVKGNTALIIVGSIAFLVGGLLWPLLSRMGYGDKNPVRSLYS